MIWRLLAWIVGGVESIFRNLAGIGGTGKDMITGIIYHESMMAILGYLIGLSTALIVFFTIIKIMRKYRRSLLYIIVQKNLYIVYGLQNIRHIFIS